MPITIYDYVDERGVNTIKEWADANLGPDKALFEAKLNLLRTAGFELPPKLLADTGVAGIKKLRFFGRAKLQWRPMLCKGPININTEATLLLGAHEKGNRLNPIDAPQQAESLRQKVIANPSARRKNHERIK